MLIVLTYVVVFSLIMDKGYQYVDYPIGTITPKVKGVSVVPPEEEGAKLYEGTIWNADDMVIPAEEGALFITTKYLITHQNRSTCPGNEDTKLCNDKDFPCIENEFDTQYGMYTGECLNNSTCEIAGWCPLEEDKFGAKVVTNVGSWQVFFKVNLRFTEFESDKSNALDKYGTQPTSGYNLFTVDEILEMADTTIADVQDKGAILLFSTKFSCNMDLKTNHQCDPKYDVFQIDNEEGTISPGFNYRDVRYNDDFDERDLIKRWGIRIIFVIDGEAGKFNMIASLLTIGAGLSFFAVATLVTDFIMDGCIDHKDKYKGLKYQDVDPDFFNTPSVSLSRAREDPVVRNTDPLVSGATEENADYSAIDLNARENNT